MEKDYLGSFGPCTMPSDMRLGSAEKTVADCAARFEIGVIGPRQFTASRAEMRAALKGNAMTDAEFVRSFKNSLGLTLLGKCGQKNARRLDRIAATLDDTIKKIA